MGPASFFNPPKPNGQCQEGCTKEQILGIHHLSVLNTSCFEMNTT